MGEAKKCAIKAIAERTELMTVDTQEDAFMCNGIGNPKRHRMVN